MVSNVRRSTHTAAGEALPAKGSYDVTTTALDGYTKSSCGDKKRFQVCIVYMRFGRRAGVASAHSFRDSCLNIRVIRSSNFVGLAPDSRGDHSILWSGNEPTSPVSNFTLFVLLR